MAILIILPSETAADQYHVFQNSYQKFREMDFVPYLVTGRFSQSKSIFSWQFSIPDA